MRLLLDPFLPLSLFLSESNERFEKEKNERKGKERGKKKSGTKEEYVLKYVHVEREE